jgi:hypothetical protein
MKRVTTGWRSAATIPRYASLTAAKTPRSRKCRPLTKKEIPEEPNRERWGRPAHPVMRKKGDRKSIGTRYFPSSRVAEAGGASRSQVNPPPVGHPEPDPPGDATVEDLPQVEHLVRGTEESGGLGRSEEAETSTVSPGR